MPDRNTQLDKALMGLRSLVMSGELEANTRLPEVALAKRLEISRTPLRQAMDRLVAEGLLDRIETGGCRVASFTIDDINDAIELRGVIEGTVARLAAERGVNEALLIDAEQILDEIDHALGVEQGPDFDAYRQANSSFHDLLAVMSGSTIIQREIERVCQLPFASPNAFLQEQELVPDFRVSLVRAQAQHREILDAIRNREGARAEALAREHARLARHNLEYLKNAGPGVAARLPGLSMITAA